MVLKFLVAGIFLFSVGLAGGCGQGWKLDYGEPAAQFLTSSASQQITEYVGAKVSIKGVVVSVDDADPQNVWLVLDHGIRCNFRNFKTAATAHEVGDVVIVDGIVRLGDTAQPMLDPAFSRDMTAPFNPQ